MIFRDERKMKRQQKETNLSIREQYNANFVGSAAQLVDLEWHIFIDTQISYFNYLWWVSCEHPWTKVRPATSPIDPKPPENLNILI